MASNPTISESKFLELSTAREGSLPKSYLFTRGICDPAWKRETLAMYSIGSMKEWIERNKFTLVPTAGVVIPKELNFLAALRNRRDKDGVLIPMEDALATTSVQSAVFRKVDTAVGAVVADAIYQMLPDVGSTFDKQSIADAAANRFSVSGGTAVTFGRFEKYFPRRGSTALIPLRQDEVEMGFRSMGMDPTRMVRGEAKSMLRASSGVLPAPGDADKYVKVNVKANMGYPTQAKIDNPAAKDVTFQLIEKLYEVDDRTSDEANLAYRRQDIQTELAKMDRDYPYLFLIQGKMKADAYKGDKVQSREARFYGVYPATVKIPVMTVMQALERDKRTIRDNTPQDYESGDFIATFSGMDIGPKGVVELVECMEAQLAANDFAYIHMGDDTWIYMRVLGKYLVKFALDCSAYDLTQRREVTGPVDDYLVDLLAYYDVFPAELYRYMIANKRVTLGGTVVVEMSDGKISGTPGQSITNGVIMAAAIERIRERIMEEMQEFAVGFRTHRTEAQDRLYIETTAASIVESVGRGLGLTVKLEQFKVFGDLTMREALRTPDRFVGYDIYTEKIGGEEQVFACFDIGRSLPVLSHPQQKWFDTTEIAQAVNSVRVSATLLAVGDPTPDMMAGILAGQRRAMELLFQTIEKVRKGEMEDPYVIASSLSEELAVMKEGDLGIGQVNYEKSLLGLYRALESVLLKNYHLESCRLQDIPFVRKVLLERQEDAGFVQVIVLPKRVRKSIRLEPLVAGRRPPTEKHIGKRPPTKPARVIFNEVKTVSRRVQRTVVCPRTGSVEVITYEEPLEEEEQTGRTLFLDREDYDWTGPAFEGEDEDEEAFLERKREMEEREIDELEREFMEGSACFLDIENFGLSQR